MISSSEYKYISDRLGEAQAHGAPMVDAFSDMMKHLDNIAIVGYSPDKEDLSGAINESYFIAFQNHGVITYEMSRAITALQNYIIQNAGSIDTFLEANNVKVTPEFAELSSLVGYEIDPSNVEF